MKTLANQKENISLSQGELLVMSALLNESDKHNILIELGVTSHEDMGAKDGYYLDKVCIGPFCKVLKVDQNIIDNDPSPLSARLNELIFNVGFLYEELEGIKILSGFEESQS